MRPPKGNEARELTERLCDIVEFPRANYPPFAAEAGACDFVIGVGALRFVVVYRTSSRLGDLVTAIETLKPLLETRKRYVVPLVAVPYMSQPGRKRCRDAGVSWIDLCGNADVRCPGLDGADETRCIVELTNIRRKDSISNQTWQFRESPSIDIDFLMAPSRGVPLGGKPIRFKGGLSAISIVCR